MSCDHSAGAVELPDKTLQCVRCGFMVERPKAPGSPQEAAEDGPALTPEEVKEAWRETHLCLRCNHAAVCGLAEAARAKPELLVAVSHCLAFWPEKKR